jgi:cyclopropane-fatty-acyl-phospholipid synthase
VRRHKTDPVTVGHELLDAAGIEVNGPAPWDIHVHDDRMFERVFRDRELGLGESYQDGWWDAERVDQFLERVQLADLRSAISPSLALLWLAARSRLSNRQSLGRARRNVTAHYDIGNDLYERMLDRRMIYSCAYWADAPSLDAAQEAKLDLICRKIGLQPGMSLLDIGCGWGGFAEFAATKYGANVVGITLAAEQEAVARERCRDTTVEIRLQDYREVTETFDRIVSIGMMEHVGATNLATFFETCDKVLAPDGLMLHHTIGSNESKLRAEPWFDRYIFPGGVIPSLEQISAAASPRWVVEDVHNFGPDYDRTLMAWLANIDDAWSELPDYDERFQRTWRYYLTASASSFRVRNLQLWQIVFRRSRQLTDVYRAER